MNELKYFTTDLYDVKMSFKKCGPKMDHKSLTVFGKYFSGRRNIRMMELGAKRRGVMNELEKKRSPPLPLSPP